MRKLTRNELVAINRQVVRFAGETEEQLWIMRLASSSVKSIACEGAHPTRAFACAGGDVIDKQSVLKSVHSVFP
jgi:hypothetical protein